MDDNNDNYTPSIQQGQRITSSYRTVYEQNLTPCQILLELYRAMIRNLDAAKNAYRNKDLGKMCSYNQRNFMILSALKDNLDRTDTSKFVDNLDIFYTSLFYSITKVLEGPDPVAEFERIEKSVIEVYKFWNDIGNLQKTISATNNPLQSSVGTNFA
jgi:flagellin-specific chaperone FliS